MKFTLYTATCRENAKNIKYPNDVEVIDEESLKSIMSPRNKTKDSKKIVMEV